MGGLDSSPRELSSWKEIAAHLGVAVRTAQSWEHERGLPVRRLPGRRGTVLASAEELDAWKWSTAAPAPEVPRKRIPLRVAAGIVLLAGLAFLAGRVPSIPPQPASLKIESNALIALDDHGRELWRKIFARPIWDGDPDKLRYTWIGDLDGDGHKEVLFVRSFSGPTQASSPLICYSDRGEERWRFVNARRVKTVDEEFSPSYWVARFVVAPLVKGGPKYVAVASTHNIYYPSQVALLNSNGKLEREYWHSGHLNRLQAADLDGDGKTEFYAAGINNAWHAVTLVVLDVDHFSGASREPQNPSHQLEGFAAGNERARVIFPRSCLGRLYPYNQIEQFSVRNGEILMETNEMFSPDGAAVFHHLSPDLRRHRVVLGDSYSIAYNVAQSAGRLVDCGSEEQTLQELRIITPAANFARR